MLFILLFFLGEALAIDLIWPSIGQVSSWYGRRSLGFHAGIDITDSHGRTVRAAEDGYVTFVGYKRRLGKAVFIDHGNGFETVYGHNSKIYVRRGMMIIQGQKISKMGSSGRSTGVHLHFEVRENEKPVDPLKYLPER